MSIGNSGIYASACKLFLKIASLSAHYPRDLRQPLSNVMIADCGEVIQLIIRASETTAAEGKSHVIELALKKLESVNLYSKLSFDCKAINQAAYTDLISISFDIKKQGLGWARKNKR